MKIQDLIYFHKLQIPARYRIVKSQIINRKEKSKFLITKVLITKFLITKFLITKFLITKVYDPKDPTL